MSILTTIPHDRARYTERHNLTHASENIDKFTFILASILDVMFLVLVPSQNGAHYGARLCGFFFTHHIRNETT